MELAHDDPEPPEQGHRGVEEHRPFVALDVDLEQQIIGGVGLMGLDPLGERDRLVVGNRSDESRDEVEELIVDRRRVDGGVGEVGAHAQAEAVEFEPRELAHTR